MLFRSQATGGKVLSVLMNADLDEAVGILTPPGGGLEIAASPAESPAQVRGDFWRWRLQMAEQIAARIDPVRFGVAALYLIGSAKNANAGPDSDIDLLVHFRGSPEQRQDLVSWLEGWSLSLDEVNFIRTGYRTGGLVDVHMVTDDEVSAKSGYAARIDAVTDPARPLAMAQRQPAGKGTAGH